MKYRLYRELRALTCGAFLGEGINRKVYQLALNEAFVIKIELGGGSFQNVSEWETWQWVQGRPIARWFAPCELISPCGLFLIQKKVEPLRKDELPPKVPAFLSDLKRENFGMLDKKIVCCDYGTAHSAIRDVSKRLVEAKWR